MRGPLSLAAHEITTNYEIDSDKYGDRRTLEHLLMYNTDKENDSFLTSNKIHIYFSVKP